MTLPVRFTRQRFKLVSNGISIVLGLDNGSDGAYLSKFSKDKGWSPPSLIPVPGSNRGYSRTLWAIVPGIAPVPDSVLIHFDTNVTASFRAEGKEWSPLVTVLPGYSWINTSLTWAANRGDIHVFWFDSALRRRVFKRL